MIEFNAIFNKKAVKRIPKSYPKLTEYESNFKIIVDNKLFFHEPNFPLLEFLYFVNEWKKQSNSSFEYISIETEDNPLISFIREKNAWKIYSPWQLFKCDSKFTKEELVNALDKLEKTVLF